MDALQALIEAHRFHNRSQIVLDRKIHGQFPELCPWRLDIYQRSFVSKLKTLEHSPESMESLTWTREQRKARKVLLKSIPRRRRGELSTALEVWSVSCAAAAALEVKSARYFADQVSMSNLIM